MRQRGLRQGEGIRRHAFGVWHSFTFGVEDWLWPMLVFRDQFYDVRDCSDVFVRSGSAGESTPVPLSDFAVLTDIRKALQRGQALGNERFREQVELALGKRLAPKRRGRKRGEGVKDEAGQMVLGL